jgi:hypothetical protein
MARSFWSPEFGGETVDFGRVGAAERLVRTVLSAGRGLRHRSESSYYT